MMTSYLNQKMGEKMSGSVSMSNFTQTDERGYKFEPKLYRGDPSLVARSTN